MSGRLSGVGNTGRGGGKEVPSHDAGARWVKPRCAAHAWVGSLSVPSFKSDYREGDDVNVSNQGGWCRHMFARDPVSVGGAEGMHGLVAARVGR